MYDAIVERVKKRLRQFHIEDMQSVDDSGNPIYQTNDDGTFVLDSDGNMIPVVEKTIVFDNLEDNPIILDFIVSNVSWFKKKLNKVFSESELLDFENTYEDILVELTMYDMCIEGAEYQKSHNENGISRTFRSKDDIFSSYGYYSYVSFL